MRTPQPAGDSTVASVSACLARTPDMEGAFSQYTNIDFFIRRAGASTAGGARQPQAPGHSGARCRPHASYSCVLGLKLLQTTFITSLRSPGAHAILHGRVGVEQQHPPQCCPAVLDQGLIDCASLAARSSFCNTPQLLCCSTCRRPQHELASCVLLSVPHDLTCTWTCTLTRSTMHKAYQRCIN